MSVPSSIEALGTRGQELGDLLERWANVNSGSSHLSGLERMRGVLRDAFTHAFPSAHVEELVADAPAEVGKGRKALSLRMRAEAPIQVLVCGHFDTVYGADDPFQSCRRGEPGVLHGPGTADMKGGIVTLLAGLQAFEGTPHVANVGWQVLLTPDEEVGSPGSAPWFRRFAAQHDFGFVFEPARSDGSIIHSRKGTGLFQVVCHGRAGHAAKVPSDGRNAVLALAEFLLAVAKLPAELPGVLVNVANIHGGSAVTNVIPDRAEAQIDVRVTTFADRDALLTRVRQLADAVNAREGYRLEIQGGFNRPPKECLPAEDAVFPAWQRAAADLGLPTINRVHAGGASDGNLLCEAGLPSLDGVGPVGDHLHSSREYCRVDTLAPRAQVFALFLHRVAAGEIVLPSRASR